ncbi:YibE/F family protein [Halanaerobium sp. Z-7514]|uniref:YibE/F family protein n=1 Tax=Halanaerobium polyolivorans TaxID=2886943 RepID=A0AAW4WXH5_9FIRM|nr:YibE/F family protein [Halanaerobium polyolivorans]MCC3144032.1 YibE/F family protein [Halanaerobium polyolivorans]
MNLDIDFKKWIFVIVLLSLIFIISIFMIPDINLTSDQTANEEYFRARVLELEEYQTEQGYNQQALVEITDGPLAGDIVEIENEYQANHRFLNIRLEEGLRVVLVSFEQNGERDIYLQDIARDRGLLLALVILALVLLVVGKVKGLETIFTLFITAFIIVRVMLPLVLVGWSPILVTTFSALTIIVLILVIIGGLNVKSLAAIIGTGSGVIIAGFLAYYIGNIAHLSGLGTQEAQMLASGLEGLDFRGLLYAGIIIASLGAITDVAMSIASGAYQIKNANPKLKFKELINHSLELGRDIMGTMANTLILAYVGGAIPFLLLLLFNQMSWLRIINMDFVATEILSGLAGTIGLVISIPITAFTAAFLINKVNIK